MNLACKHALIERGVGHIILPDEAQEIPADDSMVAGSPVGRRTATGIQPDADQNGGCQRATRNKRQSGDHCWSWCTLCDG